ncbi:MAG: sigma-70 family RNA polymerase sigma factor [Halanaerobiaceae bacterium]
MNKNNFIDLPDLPLLKEKETRNYIKKAQQGDQKALDKLVKHNLRLVLKIAYRYKNRNIELQDLFQTGVIGLIKAVKGFDLQRNVKFSTYAFSRINGEIRLKLRDQGILKKSRKMQKIARILRQKRSELKQELRREPTIKELAEETGYDRQNIVAALEADKTPTSIYKPLNNDDQQKLLLVDNLADRKKEIDISETDRLNLQELIRELDERSRKIIYLRYFRDLTQQEIGDQIGVSQVQVSRLEKKILQKLQEKLE